MWWVYIIECSDMSLYTGITTDLQRRFQMHLSGTGAKYFRGRLPKRIAFSYSVADRSQVSKLEYKIKQLNKRDKLRLIAAEKGDELENLFNLFELK